MAQIEPEIMVRGIVKDGKFTSFRPQTEQKWLVANEGKEIVRIYRPVVESTTTDQHGYLRGVIIRMCCMNSDRFAGWDEQEIYNYFVDMYFFVPVIKEMNGKSIEFKRRLSMATCGKKRSSEFISRIIQDLAQDKECPIIVPEPGDVVLNKYSSINSGKKAKERRNPGSPADPAEA